MNLKTPPFPFEKTYLPIGEIPELHESLKSVKRKYRLPPLAQPNQGDIDLSSFLILLDIFPIYVHRYRKSYRCVGNLRLWELCRAWLQPDERVPVNIVRRRFRADYWVRNCLLETLYLNVLFGLAADDCVSLYGIANEWGGDLELPPLFPSKAAYSRAMRVGKGRLARG